MANNPYESPAAVEEASDDEVRTTLSIRQIATDVYAGLMVGATYGSLGGAAVSALRVLFFGGVASVYARIEQTVMFAVFGAFAGAIMGLFGGAFVGLILGLVFRYLRLEKTVGFYWAAVTLGAVVGSFAGFGGGMLVAQRGFSDPLAMVWYPLGAVMGGMIGAMAGRQWIRIAAGKHVSPFVLSEFRV